MDRRCFLKAAGLAVAATLAFTPHCLAETKPVKPPNVVFFLVDDMGWKDPGFMGSDFYETPNTDRLARQGVVFTNAYAPAPNCAPSRACMMTGQYTPRHGVYTVNSAADGQAALRKLVPTKNTMTLSPEQITVAEALKAAGYATFLGGKWHLGEGAKTGPEGQGFDVNIGGCKAGHPPGASYFGPWQAPGLTEAPKGAHLCDFITDQALKFVVEHKDGPFFLYLPFYDVHTPMQAKDDLVKKYTRKRAQNEAKGIKTLHDNPIYAAMVENTDTNIGRVLRQLDDSGLSDNTLVIFFSDNGGHGGATSMKPLRGCKGMLYEGGIREPLIIKWPGKTTAGRTCDVPVSGIDFYPTLLEITRSPKPEGQVLDGESIVPLLLNNGGLKREDLFWHFPCYLARTPKAFKKDARGGYWRATPSSAIRRGDWKLIEYAEDGAIELFNLKDDIGEQKDLALQSPDKARELRDILKKWRASVHAPVPTQLNPTFDPLARPKDEDDQSDDP